MKEMKFTAKQIMYNNDFIEYVIYLNNEIFCHLSEIDFHIFCLNFKHKIEVE